MQKEGQNVALRSQGEKITSATNVYVIDTLGMQYLYRMVFHSTFYLNSFSLSLSGNELLRYKINQVIVYSYF